MYNPDPNKRPSKNTVLNLFVEHHKAIICRMGSNTYPQLEAIGDYIFDDRSTNGRGIGYVVDYGNHSEVRGIIYYGEDGRGG